MPDVTTLVIAGGTWTGLLVLVCALCTAAGRSDRSLDTVDADRHGVREAGARAARRAVVADIGGIRAKLRAADGMPEAEQLTVTVDVDGTAAVIATSRPVLLAQPGAWEELSVPIRAGGRTLATLHALRRPGSAPFDMTDRLMLQTLATRLATTLDGARPGVAPDRPTALA